MQKRRPVGLGPSSKTCPRWPPQRLHKTSVLRIPKLLSGSIFTLSFDIGAQKLGQPVPESNFVSEENNSFPQPAQVYVPFFLCLTYFPVNGCSVPFSLSTLYSAGVRRFLHSSSVFFILGFISVQGPPNFCASCEKSQFYSTSSRDVYALRLERSKRQACACPFTFTFWYTFVTIPFSSIKKVVRSVPMNVLP